MRFQETQTRLSITLHQIHLLPLRTLTALLTVLTRYSPRLRLVLILTTASAPGILGEVVPAAIMEALEMRVFDGVEGGDVWEEVVKDVHRLRSTALLACSILRQLTSSHSDTALFLQLGTRGPDRWCDL